LLNEAHKLGADAIINIVIDKRIERQSSGFNNSTTETWYGSALAIKYTDPLKSIVYIEGDTVVREDYYLNGNIGRTSFDGSTGGLDNDDASASGSGGFFKRALQGRK
jgi:hypothetical protein